MTPLRQRMVDMPHAAYRAARRAEKYAEPTLNARPKWLSYKDLVEITTQRDSAFLGCLKGAEKLQKLVARAESTDLAIAGCRFGECSLLESEMGVKIDLSGCH